MAEQVLWIQSELSLIHLKKFRLSWKSFFISIWMLASSIWLIQGSICPNSVSSSLATTTDQYSFSGYREIQTVGVAVGVVSRSLYYMYKLTLAVIQYCDCKGKWIRLSCIWMSSFALRPNLKSLSVDSAETNLYFTSFMNPLLVMSLSAISWSNRKPTSVVS